MRKEQPPMSLDAVAGNHTEQDRTNNRLFKIGLGTATGAAIIGTYAYLTSEHGRELITRGQDAYYVTSNKAQEIIEQLRVTGRRFKHALHENFPPIEDVFSDSNPND